VQMQGTFSLSDWGARSTSESKVEYLLDTYWDAAMNRRLIVDPEDRRSSKTYGMKPVPERKAVRRSLVFVAKMLDREADGTELLIEKMQPAALITRRQKWMYRLIGGLIGGLIFGLDTISPVEAIEISMSSEARREIVKSLRSNLIFGLIGGLIFSLIVGLIVGLIFGLIVGLIVGLIGGLKSDIQTRITPNQGIKNSVKNTVIVSAIALIFALPFKFFLESILAGMVDPRRRW
jgi:hypothetical protein